MLPLFHSLTGCDTTSFVFRKGKHTFWTNVTDDTAAVLGDVCAQLEGAAEILPDLVTRTVNCATHLLIQVFCKGAQCTNLNALREQLYVARDDLSSLPPTDDAFFQHILRSLLQAFIWVNALNPQPPVVNPLNFGWKEESRGVVPLLMTVNALPPTLKKVKSCKCTTGCNRNCGCKPFACTTGCICKGDPNICIRTRLLLHDEALLPHE